MNTSQVGDIAEMAVVLALLKASYGVLTPIGNCQRYDLVVDMDGALKTIQVKNGILKNGSVVFRTVSTRTQSGKVIRQNYTTDFFGVYCQATNECYLVPLDVCGKASMSLRVEATKNNRSLGVRMAADYVIDV